MGKSTSASTWWGALDGDGEFHGTAKLVITESSKLRRKKPAKTCQKKV
jgi:hypothetical protein